MAEKKKKKKRSSAALHRQVQDSLQALPYVVEQQRKQGHRAKAFLIQHVSGPLLRLMNKALSARRYRGEEGTKRKQTEQMRRHLEHKQAAMKHFQTQLQQQQKQQKAQKKRPS